MVTDRSDPSKIVVRRNDDTARSLDRLCEKHSDRFRAFPQNRLFQFVGCRDARACSDGRFVAIRVGGRNLEEPGHARLELRPVAGLCQ